MRTLNTSIGYKKDNTEYSYLMDQVFWLNEGYLSEMLLNFGLSLYDSLAELDELLIVRHLYIYLFSIR